MVCPSGIKLRNFDCHPAGQTTLSTSRQPSMARLSFAALQVINVDAQLPKTRSGLPTGAAGGFSF